MQITDGLILNEREVTERFVRAAGPHGQNPNREATAVELRLNLAASSLPTEVKERLRAVAGRHLTSHDVLIVVSSVFRSQLKNREGARARLLAILKRAARPQRSRVVVESTTAQQDNRLRAKHQRGAVKRSRRSS